MKYNKNNLTQLLKEELNKKVDKLIQKVSELKLQKYYNTINQFYNITKEKKYLKNPIYFKNEEPQKIKKLKEYFKKIPYQRYFKNYKFKINNKMLK